MGDHHAVDFIVDALAVKTCKISSISEIISFALGLLK